MQACDLCKPVIYASLRFMQACDLCKPAIYASLRLDSIQCYAMIHALACDSILQQKLQISNQSLRIDLVSLMHKAYFVIDYSRNDKVKHTPFVAFHFCVAKISLRSNFTGLCRISHLRNIARHRACFGKYHVHLWVNISLQDVRLAFRILFFSIL